jgi:hypothetical protein
MDFIVPLIVGLLIGWFASRVRSRPRKSPPAPEVIPMPAAGPVPAPQDLTARLKPLREVMDRFGKTASHPKELRDLEEFKKAVQRDALFNWRSGKIDDVMTGSFDLLGILAAGGAAKTF